ncbi:tetratricopeptide repeat protein [Litoribacter ruber]|uniref:Tetratricopeptide repeat protein n=1 Tax=Litoribacter ruber TaxID=702568 RepID=A0AAP2G5Q8_9BACT|nr:MULTISPECIES: tetratricopeptide repeat protein [Litoribacter]MBS9525770.1 tetratricopeptide repeat protein [Litoribacter alkaliphilus]MBT0810173.1 tetratricopeptide repeat protein [Litoribacter ruber]
MNFKKSIIIMFGAATLMFACGQDDSEQGDSYYAQGQYEQAVSSYDSYLEKSPRNVKALYNRGRAHEELGNLEQAEADFKKALEHDSKNVQVMMSLSNLYQKQKNHSAALLYADYATETSGAPAMANFLKARALHQLGNTDEALQEYSAAIKADKGFAQAYHYRGVLKLGTKNKRGGCDDLKQAVSMGYAPAQSALDKYCN